MHRRAPLIADIERRIPVIQQTTDAEACHGLVPISAIRMIQSRAPACEPEITIRLVKKQGVSLITVGFILAIN